MEAPRILVVDDELVIRESLAGWLRRDGYFVDTLESGEAAIETLKTTGYDVILLDIQMDGISGMDVLAHVKSEYPDIDVIMITAFGSIPSAVQAMKSHAFDYLLKPVRPERLLRALDKAAALSGEQQTALAQAGAQVVVDFTHPEAVMAAE